MQFREINVTRNILIACWWMSDLIVLARIAIVKMKKWSKAKWIRILWIFYITHKFVDSICRNSYNQVSFCCTGKLLIPEPENGHGSISNRKDLGALISMRIYLLEEFIVFFKIIIRCLDHGFKHMSLLRSHEHDACRNLGSRFTPRNRFNRDSLAQVSTITREIL